MATQPTYKQLENRISELEIGAHKAEEHAKELKSDHDELLIINQRLETAIEAANEMVMNAQMDYMQLSHIFNTALDAKCVIDQQFNIQKINRTFSKLFGVQEKEALNKKCFDLVPSHECRSSQCPLERILAGESTVEQDIEKKSADGSIIACLMSASAFYDPGGELYGVTISFRDITDRKLMEEKLRELATTDGLTKIFNRHHFFELSSREFERTKRYGTPLSILILDIDHFKSINDTYGHDIGDRALIRLAEVITTNLRNSDIFGRIGGEEFAVLLPNTDLTSAVSVAERLRQNVEITPVTFDNGRLHVSVSIGIAQANADSMALTDLFKASDGALYKAKENGRNRIEISPT